MKLRKVIYAKKQITDIGTWKGGQKMPKTVFPLSKSSSFKVPASYRWCCVCFECLGERFKVLIHYRSDISVYAAFLARDVNGDMLVMARLEYHATHPGWHVHTLCNSTGSVAGRTGGDDRRIPKGKDLHNQLEFGISNDDSAFMRAVKTFRLLDKPPKELELTSQ